MTGSGIAPIRYFVIRNSNTRFIAARVSAF
jgi:hypothetical protein